MIKGIRLFIPSKEKKPGRQADFGESFRERLLPKYNDQIPDNGNRHCHECGSYCTEY
jgi:hypothetical protein